MLQTVQRFINKYIPNIHRVPIMTKTIKISDDVWVELQKVKAKISERNKRQTTYDIMFLEMVAVWEEAF